MSSFKYILLLIILALTTHGCDDGERDNFPKASFIGYFNLNDPLFSGTTFEATRDEQGYPMGIAGIIVYRESPTQYYAFEKMCPHEKELSCRVSLLEDNSIAECNCCGSQFLIVGGSGDKIEGPANWPLKQYRTSVRGSMLVVSSP